MKSLFAGRTARTIDRFPRRTPGGLVKYALRLLLAPLFAAAPGLARHRRLSRLAFRGQQVFAGRRLAWYDDLGLGRLEPAMPDDRLGRYYESAYWDVERGNEDTSQAIEADGRGRDQAAYIRDRVTLPDTLETLEFGPGRAGTTCALHDAQPGGTAYAVEAAGSWRDRLRGSGRFAGVYATMEAMAEDGARCTLFLASHAMEHVSDLDATLAIIDRLVRPGGLIFIEVPHSNDYYCRHEGILIPHTLYFSDRSLRVIAGHMGWQVIDVSCWGASWSAPRRGGYFANPEGRFLRALLRKEA